MKKNQKLLTILLTTLLVMSIIGQADANSSIPDILFNEGDVFAGLSISDAKGQEIDISELSPSRKIIIFTWEQCKDCIIEYDNYSAFVSLYDNQKIEIIFIWKDSIPSDASISLFGSTKHYATKAMRSYTDWVPAYYLVDENNTIIKKTIELKWIEEYLSGVINPNREALMNWIGKKNIFFTLDGCASCNEAQKEIDGLTDKGDIYTVLNGNSNIKEGIDLHDRYAIYAHALGIQYFPAFVYLYHDEIIIVDTVDKITNVDKN